MAGSHSSLEKSSPVTPVLSRPPSLLEQEEEDDMMDSIKLNTVSKHSNGHSSKLHRLSQSIEMPEEPSSAAPAEPRDTVTEEDDELCGIRLDNMMSRISREKGSSSNSSHLREVESLASDPHSKMAQSELAPASNFCDDAEGFDLIDSELRKSTTSSIVKKGSAIDRSGARRDSSSSLKASNRGSSLSGRSKGLASPIEEADEEEEEFVSNIVKKHKRNATSLPQ